MSKTTNAPPFALHCGRYTLFAYPEAMAPTFWSDEEGWSFGMFYLGLGVARTRESVGWRS